jgi:hypothetical protein
VVYHDVAPGTIDSGMNVYISVSIRNETKTQVMVCTKIGARSSCLANRQHKTYPRFLITAAVNSDVVDEPVVRNVMG